MALDICGSPDDFVATPVLQDGYKFLAYVLHTRLVGGKNSLTLTTYR